MNYKIVVLEDAERDIKELKIYIVNNFSKEIWYKSYNKIKVAVAELKRSPLTGSIPPELNKFNLSQYRQILSGMNRIIYEVRKNTIYIHIVADQRRDMMSLVTTRLLRSNSTDKDKFLA